MENSHTTQFKAAIQSIMNSSDVKVISMKHVKLQRFREGLGGIQLLQTVVGF